jgi:hypothetical protein
MRHLEKDGLFKKKFENEFYFKYHILKKKLISPLISIKFPIKKEKFHILRQAVANIVF